MMQALWWINRIASCPRPSPKYRMLFEALCLYLRSSIALHFPNYCLTSKYVALCGNAWFFIRLHGACFEVMNQSGFEADNKTWSLSIQHTTRTILRSYLPLLSLPSCMCITLHVGCIVAWQAAHTSAPETHTYAWSATCTHVPPSTHCTAYKLPTKQLCLVLPSHKGHGPALAVHTTVCCSCSSDDCSRGMVCVSSLLPSHRVLVL
jgi:hypothetical protein